MTSHFDLFIKKARIIDGTGNPYYRADIGIRAGKIAAIEHDLGAVPANQTIDATGLVASPGFIDTHAHDDAYLLIDPKGEHKILQGVTTCIIGNCGLSLAPSSEDFVDYMRKVGGLFGAEGLAENIFKMETFSKYLELLDANGLGINVVPLVGHTTIRIAVMGWEDRAPTKREIERMIELTAESMEAGAAGLSTGLMYIPAFSATTEEIIELARVVSSYDGLYATHMRNEGDHVLNSIGEVIRIGQEAGLRVHISHHKIAWRRNWGRSRESLKLLKKARDEGLEVTCDQYPYTAGSTTLATALPPDFAAGGPDIYVEKLKDQETRKALISQIKNVRVGWENLILGAGFENIFISFSRKNRKYEGMSIAQITRAEGRNPYDIIFDLIIEEGLNIGMVAFLMDEDDIRRIMQSPLTMIGSDGIPGTGTDKIHPRMTGTFPRVLGRYVRELGVIRLEEAVRKMTSLPAQTFRLKNKGLLKEGFDADIVLFDPETVIDKGTYDEPYQKPEGIFWVFVNGRIAVENGKLTGAASGRIFKRGI